MNNSLRSAIYQRRRIYSPTLLHALIDVLAWLSVMNKRGEIHIDTPGGGYLFVPDMSGKVDDENTTQH
jgi:hypothetical protein